MSIDWPARIKELKDKAEELDLWASRSQDRQKLVLGRIADELRQFAAEIERVLRDPDDKRLQPVPDWLADDIDQLYEDGVIMDEPTPEDDWTQADDYDEYNDYG